MNTPIWLIIHHTAVSQKDSTNQFESVNTYHKQKFNFISELGYYVGYQYFIEKDGTVIQARLDDEEGAHTIGYNTKSIGICMAGNFDTELPSLMQQQALRGLLNEKVNKYHILFDNIVPHRKFTNKSCYGAKLSDDWAKNLLIEEERLTILTKIRDLYAQILNLLKGRKT